MESGALRRLGLWCLLVAMVVCGGGVQPAVAQGITGERPGMKPRSTTFRIGYIRQDPESVTTEGVFLRLRDFLLDQPAVTSAMEDASVENILLSSFETHHMLIEAMDAEQVDLAFCTVVDYAYQRGSYEPVYQLRRPGDPHSSSGGRRVWHSGVIFVNNRSPLFDMETSAALAALPEYVIQQEVAMVGSSSAAGYVYPYLALDRLTSGTGGVRYMRSVFWESSSEVVKAVINGIHDIGACDSSALDEVLKAHGLLDQKPTLVRELLRTDPVPRDPVVLHTRWLVNSPYAGQEQNALGREITRAVAAFFRRDPNLPRLERTSREPFVEVSENLERFQQIRDQNND